MSFTPNQFKLLAQKKFLPLFITQFLGAFNDNVFKNAFVILITYHLAKETTLNAGMLVTIATGLFALPFLMFSAMAGQLADKYEKSHLMQIIKIAEIALMLMAIVGFLTESMALLMAVLFLLGTHSTFFGPLKYAILPDHLYENELISGNALIEAGTFIAILIGSILGGMLILMHAGVLMVAVLILLAAILGWISSLFIPAAQAPEPDLRVSYNIFTQTWSILSYSFKEKIVFLCILGISWFWLVGATFMTQLPVFTKDIIGAEQQVFVLFLTLFSVGIAIGSMLCNRLLKGKVHAAYVPAAALGMTIFMVDLFFTSQKIVVSDPAHLMDIAQFLAVPLYWHISVDLLLISICGGVYTVPLYALLQVGSESKHRARSIASNNVMNALFMVLATVLAISLFALHFTVTDIFLTVAVLNGAMTLYLLKLRGTT